MYEHAKYEMERKRWNNRYKDSHFMSFFIETETGNKKWTEMLYL